MTKIQKSILYVLFVIPPCMQLAYDYNQSTNVRDWVSLIFIEYFLQLIYNTNLNRSP